MSEVETRLSQLRDASDQMTRSCLKIDQSMADVQALFESLSAAGWQSENGGSLALRLSVVQAELDSWSITMRKLALDLNRAADDIESAVKSTPSSASDVAYSYHGGSGRGRRLRRTATPEVVAPPLPYGLGDYVAPVNRPLYDQLTADQQSLTSEQIRLDALTQSRDKLNDDLKALKDRLHSYNPTMDVDSVPRVKAMQSQIDGYNLQITQSQAQVDSLQAQIKDLSARLEQVKPGAGADLKLISEMSHSQTAQWVKDHTEGCVNYIANRMSIPDNIAQNAYMWDNKALDMPQYGITIGNKPLVGAVIVMEREHSYADDVFGHLMYVEKVDPSGIWITDNLHSTPVNLLDLTQEVSGPNIHYLYFPWWTQG